MDNLDQASLCPGPAPLGPGLPFTRVNKHAVGCYVRAGECPRIRLLGHSGRSGVTSPLPIPGSSEASGPGPCGFRTLKYVPSKSIKLHSKANLDAKGVTESRVGIVDVVAYWVWLRKTLALT